MMHFRVTSLFALLVIALYSVSVSAQSSFIIYASDSCSNTSSIIESGYINATTVSNPSVGLDVLGNSTCYNNPADGTSYAIDCTMGIFQTFTASGCSGSPQWGVQIPVGAGNFTQNKCYDNSTTSLATASCVGTCCSNSNQSGCNNGFGIQHAVNITCGPTATQPSSSSSSASSASGSSSSSSSSAGAVSTSVSSSGTNGTSGVQSDASTLTISAGVIALVASIATYVA